MNLIEARKLGHEGWIRSPSVGDGVWVRVGSDPMGHAILRYGDHAYDYWSLSIDDLLAEDWEPKPAPPVPFEAEVWVSRHGVIEQASETNRSDQSYLSTGWRKIRVREVCETQETPVDYSGMRTTVVK